MRYTIRNSNKLRARRLTLSLTIIHKLIIATIDTARIDTSLRMFAFNLEKNRFLALESELEVGCGGATVHETLIVLVSGCESVLTDPGVGEAVQVFVVSLDCPGGVGGGLLLPCHGQHSNERGTHLETDVESTVAYVKAMCCEGKVACGYWQVFGEARRLCFL